MPKENPYAQPSWFESNLPYVAGVGTLLANQNRYLTERQQQPVDPANARARAMQESMNAFFRSLPQQEAMRQGRLKSQQEHELFPLQLKKARLELQAYENSRKLEADFPQRVDEIFPDRPDLARTIKALGFKEGMDIITHMLKEQASMKRYRALRQGELPSLTGKTREYVQVGPKGRYVSLLPEKVFAQRLAGTIDDETRFMQDYAGEDGKFSKVIAISQLPGSSDKEQMMNAVQLLPPEHPIRRQAENVSNREGIKMSAGVGLFVPTTNNLGQPRKNTIPPQAYQVKQGDTPQSIVQELTKKGIPTSVQAIIAANPRHFSIPGNPRTLRTFEQFKEPLIVPITAMPLDQQTVGQIQEKGKQIGVTILPGYGTLYKPRTIPENKIFELQRGIQRNQMFIQSIQQLMDLSTRPGALTKTNLSDLKGAINSLHRRILKTQQARLNMGVLTPGEIPFLEKSAPDYNSWVNYLFKNAGATNFVRGVYQTLIAEAEGEVKMDVQMLNHYGHDQVPETMMDPLSFGMGGAQVSPTEVENQSLIPTNETLIPSP